jgi:hypothetical protein
MIVLAVSLLPGPVAALSVRPKESKPLAALTGLDSFSFL